MTIRNISDTARWVAVYRARETERPDALFRDPYARELAGQRGEQIVAMIPRGERGAWAFVTRTYLFDEVIKREIESGTDTILNLAAGLDTRPYRMQLPRTLRWIEVDLPEILDYKEEVLQAHEPVCSLERVRLDLTDRSARRELFARIGGSAKRVLIITEGLVIYLSTEEVAEVAVDLAAPSSFQRWVLDLVSPGLLQMMNKSVGRQLSEAAASFKFAPAEGPPFFIPYGWRPIEVHSYMKTAARLRRLTLLLRVMSWFPDSPGKQGKRPWSAACLLAREESPPDLAV